MHLKLNSTIFLSFSIFALYLPKKLFFPIRSYSIDSMRYVMCIITQNTVQIFDYFLAKPCFCLKLLHSRENACTFARLNFSIAIYDPCLVLGAQKLLQYKAMVFQLKFPSAIQILIFSNLITIAFLFCLVNCLAVTVTQITCSLLNALIFSHLVWGKHFYEVEL